jgi:hypothetical protein
MKDFSLWRWLPRPRRTCTGATGHSSATTAAAPTAGAACPRSPLVTPRRPSDPLVNSTGRSSRPVSARIADALRRTRSVVWAALTGTAVGGTVGAIVGTVAGLVVR